MPPSFANTASQAGGDDCTFLAGHVAGTPIKISYFLVLMFVYQLAQIFQSPMKEWPLRGVLCCGEQALLLLTILTHEFGHGLMARRTGGRISHVLLWPFGGICFSSRNSAVIDATEKIRNELKIVAAGPATHIFPQIPIWLIVLLFLQWAYRWHFVQDWGPNPLFPNPLWLLVPFSSYGSVLTNAFSLSYDPINTTTLQVLNVYLGFSLWHLTCWVLQTNSWLFLFNVFFPMYPMDSAKLLVCSLQLFCKVSARKAATVLLWFSIPVGIGLLYVGMKGMGLVPGSRQINAGGMMSGVTAYLAVMCLSEAWNIYNLRRSRRLHTHHLFETARSNLVWEGSTRRINMSQLDDDSEDEAYRGPQNQNENPEVSRRNWGMFGVNSNTPNSSAPIANSNQMNNPGRGRPSSFLNNNNNPVLPISQNDNASDRSQSGGAPSPLLNNSEQFQQARNTPSLQRNNNYQPPNLSSPPKQSSMDPTISSSDRAKFLEKMEQKEKNNKKSVRDLMDAKE